MWVKGVRLVWKWNGRKHVVLTALVRYGEDDDDFCLSIKVVFVILKAVINH
jgi:hypothetical protein